MLILIGIIGGYKDMFNCYDIVGFKVLDLDSGSAIDVFMGDDIENLSILGLDDILGFKTYAFTYCCRIHRDNLYLGKLPIFDKSGNLIEIGGVNNTLNVLLSMNLHPISLLVDLKDFSHQLSILEYTDDCKKMHYIERDDEGNPIEYSIEILSEDLSMYLKNIYKYNDYGKHCYRLGSIAVVNELNDCNIVLDNDIKIVYFLNSPYAVESSKTVDIVISPNVKILDVYTQGLNINRYNLFISRYTSIETLISFILKFRKNIYGYTMVLLADYWNGLEAVNQELYSMESKIITHKLEAGIYKDLESLISGVKQLGFNITLY
jgi:hypothetical protein